MDELSLAVLQAELQADCRVIREAAGMARQRFAAGSEAELEGCAFHLSRLYNALEQLCMRIAGAFENRVDDDAGWHSELLRRLTLDIHGVRPAFVPAELLSDLRELRGFRHVVRHAYTLILDREKIGRVLEAADRAAAALPGACSAFIRKVAAEQGWKSPESDHA